MNSIEQILKDIKELRSAATHKAAEMTQFWDHLNTKLDGASAELNEMLKHLDDFEIDIGEEKKPKQPEITVHEPPPVPKKGTSLVHEGGKVDGPLNAGDTTKKVDILPYEVMSPEQRAIVDGVNDKQNMMVTGPAGTGKSEVLKHIRKKRKMTVTSTTGITAVAVNGKTIHSWMGQGITLGEVPTDTIVKRIQATAGLDGSTYERLTRAKILAIDEVSMLTPKIFSQIDEVLRRVRSGATGRDDLRDAPFGGLQLIMFGDFLQLPPIIKGRRKKDDPEFIFETSNWEYADVKTIVLETIFRQEDRAFSDALNEVRVGVLSQATSDLLNSRYKFPLDPNDKIKPVVVHSHNDFVDNRNKRELELLEGKLWEHEFKSECLPGYDKDKIQLEKNCLAPKNLELKDGAQVMLLWNLDTDAGLANGSLGRILYFNEELGDPVVEFNNGKIETIEQHKWVVEEDDRELASYTQYPLRLAYALTAHKIQGMTLDKVEVHLNQCFSPGQAYVALSRARTLEGLYIQSVNAKSIMAHKKAVEFYEKLKTPANAA